MCALILGISILCLITTEVGKDEVSRIEDEVRKKVSFIQEMQVDMERLIESESNADVKSALAALAEKIRYSDPMSSEELASLEKNMIDKITILKTAENKLPIINELTSLLIERNKKSKILK